MPRPPRPFRLEAVLFDFDGTLTLPGELDFDAIKRAVGCPLDRLVLEWARELESDEERERALADLERFELEAAARSRPNHGAEGLVAALRAQGLTLGVLTRNARAAVERALDNFAGVSPADFGAIVTRDDPAAPKPAPDGVLLACAQMGVAPERTLLVGDYVLDAEAGRRAGTVTALLTNGADPDPSDAAETEGLEAAPADFTVRRLDEVLAIARLGLALPEGKLPNELLGRHLDGLTAPDPALLVRAGVGEDVAALDLTGAEVLVAHSDPITLTGRDLGRYAVLVNANDIATAGATPRWFLATVLLPSGTSAAEALSLLGDIAAAADEIGVIPVGGHTEVTSAVARPVVSGTMLGVVARAGLRDKRAARPGDHIVLTKGVAVEGTALLAAELAGELRAAGLGDDELARCRRFLDHISVVPEARTATRLEGVVAMHDVTEGGLATALEELAVACGHGVVVEPGRVPVYPETCRVCAVLGLDPLGLIGSGSLLVVCRPAAVEALLAALDEEGITATDIGRLSAGERGVRALDGDRPVAWPQFAVDEAARALAGRPRG
ncbi:MAG: HAD-IA family hydrolase [Thermoleophilia bacterium]|nr:HAD-IA family hydrolase [Thermoleophilia bacterium]